MEIELESIAGKILSDHSISSEKELSAFLRDNEAAVDQIKKAAKSNQWVSFTEQSYDGWYCLPNSSDPLKYDVFYQERGAISWGYTSFKNEPDAIASVMVQSGCATF